MQIKKKIKGRGLGKMIPARLLSTRAIASVMIGLIMIVIGRIMIVTVSLFFMYPPLSAPTTVTSLTQNEAATSLKANEAPDGYASSGSDAAVKNAVVHIGPHKTGSTTIQEHSLALQPHLLSDGYGMPYAHTFTDGKKIHEPWCNQANVATCFIHNANFPCRNDLLQAGLDIGHRMNNSILLSAETFSSLEEEGVAALHDYLHPTWENITIIAYYRRYYDWIVSCYSESSRLSFAQAWHIFQQNSTDRLRQSLLNILTNTESPFPKEFLEVHRHLYVLSVIPRYKKYFSNVVVVNMHDQSMDLSERFYCELVPHASKTCKAWRHMSSTGNLEKVSTTNIRQQNVEYIELAYAAHRKGMIHVKTEQHCRDVVDAIQVYHETTNKLKISDFPRQCLQAAALKNLWELSVQAEQEFGSTVSLGNDGRDPLDVLKDDFDKKSKSKLCEIDFDVILETAVWREFFKKHAPQDEQNAQEECNKGYLKLHPDVNKAVVAVSIQSGFDHWAKYGEKEGRTPSCKSMINFGGFNDELIPPNTVMDINIGTNMSPMRGQNGRYCILADPLFAVCDNNAKLTSGVTAFCMAVENFTSCATFNEYNPCKGTGQSSSLAQTGTSHNNQSFSLPQRGTHERFMIESKPTVLVMEAAVLLLAIASKNTTVHRLKLDMQGFQGIVLENIAPLLSGDSNLVVHVMAECFYPDENGYTIYNSCEKIADLLTDAGYITKDRGSKDYSDVVAYKKGMATDFESNW